MTRKIKKVSPMGDTPSVGRLSPWRTEMEEKKMEKFKFNSSKGITLIALVITILFCYDELLKYSNNNSFLPITNLLFSNI